MQLESLKYSCSAAIGILGEGVTTMVFAVTRKYCHRIRGSLQAQLKASPTVITIFSPQDPGIIIDRNYGFSTVSMTKDRFVLKSWRPTDDELAAKCSC